MFLEFAFKALKQCKSIRRTAGKSRDDFAIMQSAHLACIALHHGFTQGHLTITADDTRSPRRTERIVVPCIWPFMPSARILGFAF
ncbi:MAG: hypothetical protein Ct9H300mP16_06460 [Pseudomonadota bacterium]|nr:MAG: hypothetical protein Ct9H300mP16_06460 [Pseudomonadota bacterium]